MAEARQSFTSLLDTTPSRDVAKGHYAFALNKFGVALEHFNNAIAQNPEKFELYKFRADTHAKLGNYGLAVQDINDAIKMRPDWGIAYWCKSNYQIKLNDFQGALATATEGHQRDPNCVEVHQIFFELSKHKATVANFLDQRMTRSRAREFESMNENPRKVINLQEEGAIPYIANDEQIAKIKKAYSLAPVMLEDLEKKFFNATEEKTLDNIFKDSKKDVCSKPEAEGISVVDEKVVMWAGPGVPHFKTTGWKNRSVVKNFPITVFLFFEYEGWYASVSRSFVFEQCQKYMKVQNELIKEDHAHLCELLRAGKLCTRARRQFLEFVKSKYESLRNEPGEALAVVDRKHEEGNDQEEEPAIQIPEVKKIGVGFGKTIRIDVLELNSNARQVKLHSGLPFSTNITYKYFHHRTNQEYAIVYGEAVIVSDDGGVTFLTKSAEPIQKDEQERKIMNDELPGTSKQLYGEREKSRMSKQMEIGEHQSCLESDLDSQPDFSNKTPECLPGRVQTGLMLHENPPYIFLELATPSPGSNNIHIGGVAAEADFDSAKRTGIVTRQMAKEIELTGKKDGATESVEPEPHSSNSLPGKKTEKVDGKRKGSEPNKTEIVNHTITSRTRIHNAHKNKQ